MCTQGARRPTLRIHVVSLQDHDVQCHFHQGGGVQSDGVQASASAVICYAEAKPVGELLMTQRCIFSGEEPDTREHVISDWLQRRFGLQHATYRLPSTSGLDYRHAKVPANGRYNGLFGEIESKISQNKFVWEEVYIWLFKIHIGLMYRDTSLRTNIKDPASETIFDVSLINYQLRLFQSLVKSYFETGQFGTTKSPPGSVFILPSLSSDFFDFQHSFTTGCIGINIGEFYLAASLWDFQTARHFEYFDWVWRRENYGSPPANATIDEIAAWYHHVQAIWLCNLGYWSFRWNINMYRITKHHQPVLPAFCGAPFQRAEDPHELAQICQTFGLELKQFIPDGKSTFGALPNRLGGDKMYRSKTNRRRG